MTFIIRRNDDGSGEVENTESTTANFASGGKTKIEGNFINRGNIEVDIRANLEIIGNLENLDSGNFHIKDYVTEEKYRIIESAISELNGEAKEYLEKAYQGLREQKEKDADTWFKKFISYLKENPTLITGSVGILLQIFN